MQFKTLTTMATMVAVSAPLAASAFGDLDCITIQSCDTSRCTQDTTPFGVTFNWADESVTVSMDGANRTLPWAATDTTTDAPSTVLEYGDVDDINGLLRIEAVGTEITAHYAVRTPRVTTWEAACDLRQAA